MKTLESFRPTAAARLGVIIAFFAFAISLTLPAAAQTRAQKIGVVDVDRIMRSSVAFQSAAKRIENEMQPLKEKYGSKLKERDAMEQSIRERSTVLKPEEVAQQKEKYFALDAELRDVNYTIGKETDRLQRETLEPVMQRLKSVIESVAKGQGYDLVLYANQLFYFSESVDLTPQVLQSLDRGAGTVTSTEPAAKAGSSSDDAEENSSSKSTRSSSSRRSRRD